MAREQFSGNLITLDLTDEQRDDAEPALRRAALRAIERVLPDDMHLLDGVLLTMLADQIAEARAESSFEPEGIPVELVFSSLQGERGAA